MSSLKFKNFDLELDQKYQAQYYYLLGWANKGDNKLSEAVSFLKKSDSEMINLDKYKEECKLTN